MGENRTKVRCLLSFSDFMSTTLSSVKNTGTFHPPHPHITIVTSSPLVTRQLGRWVGQLTGSLHEEFVSRSHQGQDTFLSARSSTPALQITRCTASQGSPRTPATCIAATTPELIVEILNSVFFKFLNFLNFEIFSNFSEVQTYSLMMIC